MTRRVLYLLLLLCPRLASTTFKAFRSDLPENDYYIPGDVNIGMIDAMATSSKDNVCDEIRPMTRQSANAAVFRINEINHDQTNLPNISLGLVILNDCWHNPTALYRSTKLIPVQGCADDCCNQPIENATNPTVRGCYNVAAAQISYSSSMSELESRLLSMYKIPHISLGATADVLSDRAKFKYFNRLMPPDKLQVQALIGTIVAFNWTYISLIGTTSVYSRNAKTEIRVLAKEHGICIAYSVELLNNFNDDDYDDVIKRLRIHSKAKVVVMFTESMPGVFKAVTRAKAQGEFIFFTGEGFYFQQDGAHPGAGVNGLQTYPEEAGSRRFDRFEKYYRGLSPWAHMDAPDIFQETTPKDVGCSMELMKGTNGSCFNYEKLEDLPSFRQRSMYRGTVDAINIISHALHEMISDHCPSAFEDKSVLEQCIEGERLLGYIRNTTVQGYSKTIKLDAKGDGIEDYTIWQWQADGKTGFDYFDVGKWDLKEGMLHLKPGKLKWFSINETLHPIEIDTPESVCAKPCKQGEFYIQGELKCCWECRKCRDNEKVRDDFKGCTTCPELTWPDQENFTTCEPIPPSYMNWLDPIALGLLGLSIIGLLSTFAITCVFLKHKQKKVVKGSSLEQMVTILVALYLSYSTAILMIVKPVYSLCLIQFYSFHLSCTLTFVPLLLKTTRLYRIFAAAEKCQQVVRFVSSRALGLFSLTLISIVVGMLVVCTVMFDLGDRLQMPVITVKFVELVCHISNETLLIPLCYNLLLLLMCAVYGFLTRKLPDNFNESWYIFISVSTTLFVWLAFLPTYSMAFYAYHKSALLGLAMILNAAVTAVCLFAPKIYAIYYITEDNIKVTNFEGASNTGGQSQK